MLSLGKVFRGTLICAAVVMAGCLGEASTSEAPDGDAGTADGRVDSAAADSTVLDTSRPVDSGQADTAAMDSAPRPDVMLTGCESGPLELPIPGCRPTPLPSTGDFEQDCVDRINQLRWECQCLPPLQRWTDAEACATMMSEYDSTRSAHAGFRERICSPGGRGQNECPGYPSQDSITGLCLQQMWDEGPGEDFQAHGHYINMTNPAHSRVACGIFVTPGGRVWSVQNFN